MSSLRNAVQRRNHKERVQPHKRQKLGILEKHKDYALRAKDYNVKKRQLGYLRQRATERNPDEFHFGMMKSQTDKFGRKLSDRGNIGLADSSVRLLKTQDAGYIRMMTAKARRERERLEERLLLNDSLKHVQPCNKATNFKNSGQKLVFRDRSEILPNCSPSLQYNATEKDVTVESQSKEHSEIPRSGYRKSGNDLYTRLDALKNREKGLNEAEISLGKERAQMNNNAAGVSRDGVKFKSRRRKR